MCFAGPLLLSRRWSRVLGSEAVYTTLSGQELLRKQLREKLEQDEEIGVAIAAPSFRLSCQPRRRHRGRVSSGTAAEPLQSALVRLA